MYKTRFGMFKKVAVSRLVRRPTDKNKYKYVKDNG
jgi:hypothetical protein